MHAEKTWHKAAVQAHMLQLSAHSSAPPLAASTAFLPLASQPVLRSLQAGMKRKQYGVPGAVDEAPEPQPEDNQYVKVTPLGAGQEVGRSCVILQY